MATTSTHELQKLSFLEQFDLAGEETQGRRIKLLIKCSEWIE
jgi:hypothetical protein